MSATRGLDLAAVGLILFGALVRIVGFLQNASLSGDEAMLALNIGRRSFRGLLQPLDYGQVATVPFLWAERLVAMVGGVSGYSLRIITLLAGIGLLWVLYRLGQELVGRVGALTALALSATAFPLIRYSVEVKPYILDALISAGLVWVAVRLMDEPEDGRRWLWLTISGAVAVLVSAPALFVGAAVLFGLGIASVATTASPPPPPAGAPRRAVGGHLRRSVSELVRAECGRAVHASLLGRGIPPSWNASILRTTLRGVGDLSCTLTCWRGLVDLSPLLLLLAIIGLINVARRRGPEFAVFLGAPILAAFGASALGGYPIATRLVLFSAPLLVILVAGGAVAIAQAVERSWPRVHARWLLLLLVYPSLILAATLAFAPPSDWGFHGVEVRPLAEVYQQQGEKEPIYVFPRAVPAWVFHTTDWSSPDTMRLRWVAQVAGPRGLGFVNGPSRGRRRLGEGADLAFSSGGKKELLGTSTGAQGRVGVGYTPPEPDPGWAESEAWRIRTAAKPYIWVVMSDYAHGRLDERAILMKAVQAAGGEVVYTKATADAVLFRIRFPPTPVG